jgi:Tol biopolymer transport system component
MARRFSSAGCLVVCAAFLTLALIAPSVAEAGTWDPRLRWQTIQTANFDIHFHQDEGELAIEMARVAEEVHTVLSPYLEWQPLERTQVVLVDPTDRANGSARTIPFNAIVLYTVPPDAGSTLDNHQNWLWALFLHEYTHILQIDMVDGLPLVLRYALGRLITPNAVLPKWLTEGYATYLETLFTRGGRGRSTTTETLLRTAALAGRLPRIDEAEGFGQRWPGGQSRYLYGASFHLYVAERSSEHAWIDFHKRHSRGVIPFLLPSKKAFDHTFVQLWKDWRRDTSAHYLAQAEQIRSEGTGLTPSTTLPTRAGIATRPFYSADGDEIFYVHSSAHEASSLRAVRRDGLSDRLVRRGGISSPELSKDGKSIFWSSTARPNRYVSRRDLYRYDLAKKKRQRLSRGARLYDLTMHPQQGYGVAVQNRGAQNQLVVVDFQKDQPEVNIRSITSASDGTQYANPTFDPSGERLAVSVWKPGGFRDIHVLDDKHKHLRAISWDRASDIEPFWSLDGRWLLWSSDRDGTWNLYAYRWSDARVFRVTRLLGAARHGTLSPDGSHIAFQGYGSEGWRLEEIPFTPDSWEPADLPGRMLPGPDYGPSAQALAPQTALEGVPGPPAPHGHGPDRAIARARLRDDFRTLAAQDEPNIGKEQNPREKETKVDRTDPGPGESLASKAVADVGKVKKYNPLLTLFPPRTLSLMGAITDTGALGGLSTGGADVLGQHSWGASIHYRTDSRFFGWSAGYRLSVLRPSFSVNYSNLALDYGRTWLRARGATEPGGTNFDGSYRGQERYFERRDRLFVGMSLPIALRQHLSAYYKLEFRRPLRDLPSDVDPQLLPAQGSFSGLVLGWSTGRFQRYPASISPQDSHFVSASAEIESSYLGAYRTELNGEKSSLHRAIVTVEGRGYISLPWAKNHVLALRGVLGGTLGTQIPQGSFRIGGPYGDSPYVSLPDRYYALRGYPTSSMRGDHIYLGSAEYRMPLAFIERGLWTAPIWLRSISLSVIVEAGQVWRDADYADYEGSAEGFVEFWKATRPAVGVELVGDLVIFWGSSLQGRVGYALGLGEGAFSSGSFYAQLGASF